MTDKSTSKLSWAGVQAGDVERFGEDILDEKERRRWCGAVAFAGTLPYLWRHKAAIMRDLAYDKLAAKSGDKVLIIGEAVEACGFDADIGRRIAPSGTLTIFDITDEAREAAFTNRRGSKGQLATWRWDYTRIFPADHFDAIAVLQAVQHSQDWSETGRELMRVLKPGGHIVLAETVLAPSIRTLIEQDVHVAAWVEKLFEGVGFLPWELAYYSIDDLQASFEGMVESSSGHSWKGVELFWATKPSQPSHS
jgi:SAM-dependent methyltransferase